MIGLVKCTEISFFQNMLLCRLDIDSIRIVDRRISVADSDDFYTALVSERERSHRADVSETLHNRGAFFRIHLQHVQRALDEINDAASGRFAPAFSAAD